MTFEQRKLLQGKKIKTIMIGDKKFELTEKDKELLANGKPIALHSKGGEMNGY